MVRFIEKVNQKRIPTRWQASLELPCPLLAICLLPSCPAPYLRKKSASRAGGVVPIIDGRERVALKQLPAPGRSKRRNRRKLQRLASVLHNNTKKGLPQ